MVTRHLFDLTCDLCVSGAASGELRVVLLQPGVCEGLAGHEEARPRGGGLPPALSRLALQSPPRPLELPRSVSTFVTNINKPCVIY